MRDRNLLLASLDRPKNLFAYGEPTPTVFELAAAFAFAKNHAFIDGNKRVAFKTKATFLILNGYSLEVPEKEVVLMIKRLSTAQETQESIADWIQENCIKIGLTQNDHKTNRRGRREHRGIRV
ncbi:MAG: type II toxin-antitoxin system death-on-curing family toxin [Nostoc sp.]